MMKVFFDEARGGMQYFQRTVLRVIEALSERKEEALDVIPNGLTVSVRGIYSRELSLF